MFSSIADFPQVSQEFQAETFLQHIPKYRPSQNRSFEEYKKDFIEHSYPAYFESILSENVYVNYIRLRESSFLPELTKLYYKQRSIPQTPLLSPFPKHRYIYAKELLTLTHNSPSVLTNKHFRVFLSGITILFRTVLDNI